MPPEFPTPSSNARTGGKLAGVGLIAVILLAGIVLRIFGPPAFETNGHDEILYSSYVDILNRYSLASYPKMVELYTHDPKTTASANLPPTRVSYIFLGYCWSQATGQLPIDSLHGVSCLFSILTIPLAAFFAWRLGGTKAAVCVAALVAFSPVQIYTARHALIDGFFGFWALTSLWLLWENLQKPANGRWLTAYVAAIACMVMTKENALFAFIALVAILVVNRWAKFGEAGRPLVMCTFAGGVLGAAGIAVFSGGLDNALAAYIIFGQNLQHLQYAIETGDGPWHRYLVELLMLSPVVFLLVVAAVFRVTREKKELLFLFTFIGASYLIMCNLRNGMNLRYTNMWDMPMRYIAFTQVVVFSELFKKYKTQVLAACIVVVCALDLRQYRILFVDNKIYEPIPKSISKALKIIK